MLVLNAILYVCMYESQNFKGFTIFTRLPVYMTKFTRFILNKLTSGKTKEFSGGIINDVIRDGNDLASKDSYEKDIRLF